MAALGTIRVQVSTARRVEQVNKVQGMAKIPAEILRFADGRLQGNGRCFKGQKTHHLKRNTSRNTGDMLGQIQ